jgi:flagellar M-ring protein FliF
MNERITQLREQGKQILSGFSTGQKTVTAIAIVAVLLGSYLFTSWASKADYAPLFTGLEASDAAAVTDALQSTGTPYKLSNSGATIMVPANDVASARLSLSAKGLPQSSTVGWGILDKQGITASEFQQRTGFQRALEGELDKTLSAMDGVLDTTVHLVVPKDDLFSDDARKASASVLLKLKSGTSLSATQVQSVVHLVSSAVEGLSADNVTVSDSAGHLLSAPGQEGADLAAGDFRAQQTAAYEARITKKVKDFLTSVVGPTGADVRVHAELNFDSTERTDETFGKADGTEPPVVNETKTDETYSGGSALPGGALGQTQVTLGNGNNAYTKQGTQRTNAVDKQMTHSVSAPGAVARQSVAVLLDTNKSRSVNLQAMQQQVAAAAGIDPARGDIVRVSRMPFDTTVAAQQAAEEKSANADQRMHDLLNLLKTVGTLVVVGFGLMFGYRRLRGAPVEELLSIQPLALEAGEDDLLDLDEDDYVELESRRVVQIEGGDPTTVLVQRRRHTELDRLPGLEERMAENADIADLIDRQPDDVALLLRGWLSERR